MNRNLCFVPSRKFHLYNNISSVAKSIISLIRVNTEYYVKKLVLMVTTSSAQIPEGINIRDCYVRWPYLRTESVHLKEFLLMRLRILFKSVP